MRKVLAVASVGAEHKELVLKDLKSIFKRIKISLQTLLQEEMHVQDGKATSEPGSLLKSYPYITLTIPNYEQHREYLEKVYKNNVLFSKFILLISKGDSYEDLIKNRNEDILREQCRNWNNSVSCSFDSTPVFTEIEEQMSKVDTILGEMDIRGKINQIDAQKRFHLIQDHRKKDLDDPHPVKDPKVPSKKSLLQLFFGLEVVRCGRRGRVGAAAGGITVAADSRFNCSSEFMEYQEETMEEYQMIEENGKDRIKNNQNIQQCDQSWQDLDGLTSLRGKRPIEKRTGRRRCEKPTVKEANKNPYLKKQFPDEVVVCQAVSSK